MRVAIHRNLTTGKWVISSTKMTRNGERKDKRLDTVDSIHLSNVSFVTPSQKTVDRICSNLDNPNSRSGREVVAYAIGDVSDEQVCTVHVSWNPRKGADFYTENGKAAAHYAAASFTDKMRVQ